MFGRDVITRFDRLKQNTLNTNNEMKCNKEIKKYKGKTTKKKLDIGVEVFIRDILNLTREDGKLVVQSRAQVDQIIKSGNFYNEVFNESLNETFYDGDFNNLKSKATDSKKETYHSETSEPSSTRRKRKCILPVRYRLIYII